MPACAFTMLLQKTDKARLELSPGVRTLSLRERSLLLLADGKSLSDLQAMYNGIGAQIVDNLMRQGYLTGPAALRDAIRPAEGSPDSIPGVLLRATTNSDHWLSAGVAPELNILVSGSDIYAPLRLDQGANVVSFGGPDDLLAAGYIWDENRAQLAYKPAVVAQSLGSGQLIGFAHDPSARGFMRGLDVLFLNAVFRGSSHTR